MNQIHPPAFARCCFDVAFRSGHEEQGWAVIADFGYKTARIGRHLEQTAWRARQRGNEMTAYACTSVRGRVPASKGANRDTVHIHVASHDQPP